MLGHSVNLTGRTGSAMQRMTAHIPSETLTKSDVRRIVNEMKILGMGASARHALQVSLSHVNQARAANDNAALANLMDDGRPPKSGHFVGSEHLPAGLEAERRLSKLMSQLNFGGRIVSALFLVLWDAKSELLPNSEIEVRLRKLASPRQRKYVVNIYVKQLRRELFGRDWPVSVVNTPGKGYTLVVRQADFEWDNGLREPSRAQISRSARTFHSPLTAFRTESTPALFDFLLGHEGQIVSGADLRSVIVEATGDRMSSLKSPLDAVRRLIRDENLPFELQRVKEVGYRLVKKDSQRQLHTSEPAQQLSDGTEDLHAPVDENPSEAELLSNERLAELMNALSQDCSPRAARVLLVLWYFGGRTISFDKLEDMLFDMTLSDRGHLGLVKVIHYARKAANAAGWPVDISSKRKVGVRLTRTDPAWNWEAPRKSTYGVLVPEVLGAAADWTVDERIALLSDFFPGTMTSALRLLFLLLEHRRNLQEYHALQTQWENTFENELNQACLVTFLVHVRASLRRSGLPIRLETERGIGIRVVMSAMPTPLIPIFSSAAGSHAESLSDAMFDKGLAADRGSRSDKRVDATHLSRLPRYVAPKRRIGGDAPKV